MGNLLPSSLRATHLADADKVIENRWLAFDFSLFLFYSLDTVSAKLLPIFAEQYAVTQYVNTEAQTRAFLKKVIALYRKKGTAWAMREALAALGWPNAEIIETGPNAVALKYDGQFKYDGAFAHGGGDWATFRVRIPLAGQNAPGAIEKDNLTAVINEFKPARCVLLNLTFY